ncbi:hypothetical protein LTR84_006609 [Exophiala bonariae]|uniref:Uncharacterized protein n=1 Tax=Exophiala bonariae TaxID=1690606 RepID=A0AAV9N403_9EURO|nr:hypothetical protein LTR84_006609 [Exophiala bonariae]
MQCACRRHESETCYGLLNDTLLATNPTLGEGECRSFAYLRSKAVPEIFGVFDTDFWSPILQRREAEPVLQHALSSLSAVYEHYRRDGRLKSGPNRLISKRTLDSGSSTAPLSHFAIQQYNKAIKLLTKDGSSDDSDSIEVTLMACLIFVCIEFLGNNFSTGLNHLKGGLKILDHLKNTQSIDHTMKRRPLNQALKDLYIRLDIQATVHGSATSDFNSTAFQHWQFTPWLPTHFSTIGEAQTKLSEELCAIFQFMRHRNDESHYSANSSSTSSGTCDAPPSLDSSSLTSTSKTQTRTQLHLGNLRRWHDAFSSLVKPDRLTSIDYNAHQRHTIPLLFLYHDLAVLQLKASTFKSQMEYDEFQPEFERMVTYVWRVLQAFDAIGSRPPVVSFDMGLLGPLFFIALKCRHLRTRQRAIGLMRLAPEREGMWIRDPIIEYSEWKMKQEEAGRGALNEDAILPEESRMFGETVFQAFVNGEQVRVLRFYKGKADALGVFKSEEVVTNMSLDMGDFL